MCMYLFLMLLLFRSHFLSHVHLDFLCHLITFVNCAKNSIAGSDVIPGSMIQQMIWNHSRFLDVILANLEPNPLPATLLAKGKSHNLWYGVPVTLLCAFHILCVLYFLIVSLRKNAVHYVWNLQFNLLLCQHVSD